MFFNHLSNTSPTVIGNLLRLVEPLMYMSMNHQFSHTQCNTPGKRRVGLSGLFSLDFVFRVALALEVFGIYLSFRNCLLFYMLESEIVY